MDNEGFRVPRTPASSAAPAGRARARARGRGRGRSTKAKQKLDTSPAISAQPSVPMPRSVIATPTASGSRPLYSALHLGPEQPRSSLPLPAPPPQAIPTRGITGSLQVTDRARQKSSRKLAEQLDEAIPTAEHWKKLVASMNVYELKERAEALLTHGAPLSPMEEFKAINAGVRRDSCAPRREKCIVRDTDFEEMLALQLDINTTSNFLASCFFLMTLQCMPFAALLYAHGLRPGTLIPSEGYGKTDFFAWGHIELILSGVTEGVGLEFEAFIDLSRIPSRSCIFSRPGGLLKVPRSIRGTPIMPMSEKRPALPMRYKDEAASIGISIKLTVLKWGHIMTMHRVLWRLEDALKEE
ncbi:hypothetical protein BDP27DRAFT_1365416 [Rhodocollybia butyracea]|uniref:Uncharacterized protein n=1 Tax=Rhodocollybia butyracea TaxID=206335 RepID=A0A9P5U6F3_9AGAR|nr:hypothetical protein BDP27DRAFT_1365416 [Rhodocollybia butyracea]